ncbi:DsbA family protein [Meiothermus taiwanensis]|jgi:protein-disulfide isomerase|uniref:Disulfide bond formation protein D n=2 Tax=Meiothermus taiwanensis TaxID=172827 RepID=A0A399E3Z5_9DEIN|nr:DsbA family protein [Meiothermus taiwanensis]AWR86634.1 DSBA oxidoreductase [Meiothermus taiwanensis WR-220]KIQ55563.1 thiol:disulfide interchange protein [Meiothermus taiwanensis]KZK15994.1 thiol:disulfide interchange protein [Meiothermus taiwanensis]RIH78596.1 Disulfide bond formation protein D [Meiothermus taiwanensis]
MQRTLFVVVAVLAIAIAAVLFVFLRPKPTAGPTDAAAGARFVIGNPEAKVTVVDFSNYLCSHCRDHANEVFPLIKRDYIDTGKIRYVFRDFPFGGQENVIRAGEAAACAADNNLYVEYHEALFRAQMQWAGLSGDALDNYFADLAGQIGIAPATFLQCLKSGSKRAGVLADQKLATDLGLTGTPSFIVNGEKYTGQRPYDSWREILDKALAGQPSSDQGGSSSPAKP